MTFLKGNKFIEVIIISKHRKQMFLEKTLEQDFSKTYLQKYGNACEYFLVFLCVCCLNSACVTHFVCDLAYLAPVWPHIMAMKQKQPLRGLYKSSCSNRTRDLGRKGPVK